MKLALALVFLTRIISSESMAAGMFDKDAKRVTVTGQCVMESTPDRGAVTFVVENLDSDAKTAIQKTTELHEKLRDELKRSRVKNLELSTTEYTVNERKEWEHNRLVNKGFAARLGLRASTTEIGQLGELLAIAARVGVKETSGLMTYLSEQKTLDDKKKCLETAAKNAREKAEALAHSLGVKVGHPLQILEAASSASQPPMQPMMESFSRSKSAAADLTSPTIEGRKQTLSQDVEVTFALE